jgi:hypothetical protein
MPTSTKSPKHNVAKEFFVLKNNRREDADLHNAILADGDDAAAKAVSDAVARRLKAKREAKRKIAESLSDWTPIENALRQGEWKDTKARALRARRRKS